MVVAPLTHPIWRDLVTGKRNTEFECLALKILLSRLQVSVANKSISPENAAEELYTFFVKNDKLPSAQRDLTKILG